MRETVLKSVHEAAGARLVPFAGWNMPVQYQGILDEVRMVRQNAGLFDLGHMGRVRLRGPQSEDFLQRLQTNDASAIQPGRIRYAMILDDDGLIQDDILVYREPEGSDAEFFVVINAGNCERDLAIMRDTAADFDVEVIDQTDELGMLAIQGPKAEAITQKLVDTQLSDLRYYAWTKTSFAGHAVELSRTGYTGEDGFEVYAPQAVIEPIWNAFLETGGDEIAPIGLAARDTLRLEAGMALYGHEIDEGTNPLEANLAWAVKFTHDFRGRAALEKVQEQGGSGRRLVGLKSDSRRVPREGYTVHCDGQEIGAVRSGAMSPTLDTNIATAYVLEAHAEPGTAVTFSVRDRHEPAVVTALPFYKRPR